MTGLPIRWKLTLAFAAALAVVLTAVGAFVYLELSEELDDAMEHDLQARTEALKPLAASEPVTLVPSTTPDLELEESIAHIVTPDGTVLAATFYGEVRLLTDDQLRRAAEGPLLVDRPDDRAIDESLRMLATPVDSPAGIRIIIVCASLDEKHDALEDLLRLEIIGLAAALAVSCAVGYGVAGLALRPVEALRRRAAEVTLNTLTPDSPLLPESSTDDEIGRLGRTLNAMLDRIRSAQTAERAAMDRQRQFVADASHQIRTPLTIMKSEVELALMGSDGERPLRAALESVSEEADRLSRLTAHLLLLAAVDDDALVLSREPVDVRALLTTVADRHRSRVAAAGRGVTVAAGDHLTVSGDRVRLEQALANLVDNALLHGAGEVELSAWSDASGMHLGVRDQGPGFGPDPTPAFARFARGRGSGTGTGLGLAIVQAVAEAHGGHARAYSDNTGSWVTLTLPQAPNAPDWSESQPVVER